MINCLTLHPKEYWLDKLNRRTVKGDNGCWLWTGPMDKDGYGCLTISTGAPKHRKPCCFRTHMISYEIHHGDRDGLCVLHRCDNAACWNPEHLFGGTQQDNMADKIAKDRQAKGSRIGHAKLSEDDVREIYRLRGRVKLEVLADRFGVHFGTISKINHGRIWRHITVDAAQRLQS